MRLGSLLLLITFSSFGYAAGGAECGDYGDCDEFDARLLDNSSLQRGLNTFINNCYGCHSLQYSRWGRVAKDLDIPESILFEKLVFDPNAKSGDLMKGSLDKKASEEWFGVAPPDLTLVARSRGSNWIYTYLRTYYEDGSKQYGVNNLVYPNTAMPNVLEYYQGKQILGCKQVPSYASNGGVRRDADRNIITEEECGHLLLAEGSGKYTAAEFDTMIFDLTNFLTYVAEPVRADRERIGWFVILFFVVFTALSYLLFREYQKDYH